MLIRPRYNYQLNNGSNKLVYLSLSIDESYRKAVVIERKKEDQVHILHQLILLYFLMVEGV